MSDIAVRLVSRAMQARPSEVGGKSNPYKPQGLNPEPKALMLSAEKNTSNPRKTLKLKA